MICLLILRTQIYWLLETKESILTSLVNGNEWKLDFLHVIFLTVAYIFLILGLKIILREFSSLLMLLAWTELILCLFVVLLTTFLLTKFEKKYPKHHCSSKIVAWDGRKKKQARKTYVQLLTFYSCQVG